ncbi:cysteine proteinase [Lophiostoma macrostomum CBS 122681]|uniref:Cysteine proteinase n=1 Tax=Lophiostoma macrostomum CBS 122681 TaxID=1314788 RepID=A0A6A6T9F9_9PLEO|nr:cysteine proteinase [Lophiostoma macrostomum CBS 122681]
MKRKASHTDLLAASAPQGGDNTVTLPYTPGQWEPIVVPYADSIPFGETIQLYTNAITFTAHTITKLSTLAFRRFWTKPDIKPERVTRSDGARKKIILDASINDAKPPTDSKTSTTKKSSTDPKTSTTNNSPTDSKTSTTNNLLTYSKSLTTKTTTAPIKRDLLGRPLPYEDVYTRWWKHMDKYKNRPKNRHNENVRIAETGRCRFYYPGDENDDAMNSTIEDIIFDIDTGEDQDAEVEEVKRTYTQDEIDERIHAIVFDTTDYWPPVCEGDELDINNTHDDVEDYTADFDLDEEVQSCDDEVIVKTDQYDMIAQEEQVSKETVVKYLSFGQNGQVQTVKAILDDFDDPHALIERGQGKPLIPELTDEDYDILQVALDGTDNGSIELELVEGKLTTHDFKTLLPDLFNGNKLAWLNDNIINEYLSLLVEAEKARLGFTHTRNGSAPPVHAFASQWYTSMRNNPDSVTRWATRKNLGQGQFLDARLILIPICDQSHWRLIAIKPQDRLVEYYDSLNGEGDRYFLHVIEFLKKVLGREYSKGQWDFRNRPSVPQENNSDCGVFTCLNALCLLRQIDVSYLEACAEPGMTEPRCRLAVTLLKGQAIEF